MTSHLLILAERDALSWVLRHERMAFHERRAAELARVAVGDVLLLYTTRACFHNPTRDVGRVMGRATVMSPVEPLEQPVSVMGRNFQLGCTFRLNSLAP